jgi:hypothetical protein
MMPTTVKLRVSRFFASTDFGPGGVDRVALHRLHVQGRRGHRR